MECTLPDYYCTLFVISDTWSQCFCRIFSHDYFDSDQWWYGCKTGKVSILGVVALLGDCRDTPTDVEVFVFSL